MRRALLVQPLNGGAVLGGAVKDLNADLVSNFAIDRKVDGEGCAHHVMIRTEIELEKALSCRREQ